MSRLKATILCIDDHWNGLIGRKILLENNGYKVLEATGGDEGMKLFLSHPVDAVVLDYLDEMFTLHPSPTQINKGTLTLSSRRRLCRHHRHLLCRRLRLPLHQHLLLRLALVEGGHRQLPTDRKGLTRSILDVFCSCPMVRLVRRRNAA